MANRSHGHDGPASGVLLLFAGASLLAVAMGGVVAASAGVAPASWARNLVAWLLGALSAVAISRRPSSDALAVPLGAAAITGLAATFVNDSQDGVHRWWDIGPLHVHAAAILLPLGVVVLARSGRSITVVAALSIALTFMLAAQPDASQATAFAAAMSVAVVLRRDQPAWRWIAVGLLVAGAGLSWLRPDPLEPVPEVEEIVQLAWKIAPAAAILGVLGLAAAALAPLAARGVPERGRRSAALALSIYIAIVTLAPLVGAFPVPLMGIGMSPIVGLWLGIGLLAAPSRRSA